MVAEKQRKLKDGNKFDHLFPLPSATDTVIKKSADVEDTLELIRNALPETTWQTNKIAGVLKGRTLEETCSNIWHFVYDHVQYRRDKEGVEQVRSPRRSWWDREEGVDCDCYTVLILSILRSLKIDCLARITKYPKRFPEVPRWQHVYPIVPKPGHLDDYQESRGRYIVMDCVKDAYDDEEPYLECKDYDMRLDYLDGLDNKDEPAVAFNEYESVDLSDLASLHDDEEMGNILKKVGSVIKKTVKKVGDKVGDGIRFINRYINPATLLLRNGFLLAMKINLMNVAGRLRYAYLTDSQAQALGMNMNELKKLRTIKDRAETVYWQAGGKKENLKKAILKGKGNSDRKVALSGLGGVDDHVYADEDEYTIIHTDDLDGLGELASGTAIAAASSAVAAVSAALKQVKGLFLKDGGSEQAFQSDTNNAGTTSSAPSTIPDDEDAMVDDGPSSMISKINTALTTAKPVVSAVQQKLTPGSSSTTMTNATQSTPSTNQTTQSVLPGQSATGGSMLVPGESSAANVAAENETDEKKSGILQKTTTWVKANPGKTLLVAGGVLAGGYLLVRAFRGSGTQGLDGVPSRKKPKNKQRRKKPGRKKEKVKAQNLL